MPVGMGKLRGNYFHEWRTRDFGQMMKDFFGTHDPEHIKTTERIEGV
jgi:hypothetical protein